MKHPRLVWATAQARARADKRVLGIDGQYSVLMNVLYQVPHGQPAPLVDTCPTDAHTFLTVQCKDSVLLARPYPSEAFEHQIDALLRAVGEGGAADVRLVASDNPPVLDRPALYLALPNNEAVAMDPLHVALNVEKASNEHPTMFSQMLRKCLVKFGRPFNDGRPLYRAGMDVMVCAGLREVMESMSARRRDMIVRRVASDGYSNKSYDSVQMFVDDVAGLASQFPQELGKKTGKGVTVLDALAYATRPVMLEYLFNNTRLIARNPSVDVMYGTTRNEAFHEELKGFFRNIRAVRARRAHLIGEVVTVTKLLAGATKKTRFTSKVNQADNVRAVAAALLSGEVHPFDGADRLDARVVYNEPVDVSSLPLASFVPRKRPAARPEVARPQKRPAAVSKRPATAA